VSDLAISHPDACPLEKAWSFYRDKLGTTAQMSCLFGCDAYEHRVSFLLEFYFTPALKLERTMKVNAAGGMLFSS